MLEAVGRSKLRDLVATQLKSYIHDAELKPGDRLPTESELAVTFGVSRLSLREATKSLEYLGIVEAKPGRGLTVGAVNMDRVTECIGFHPALLNAQAETLIGTRIALETGALSFVCSAMLNDSQIYRELYDINQELAEAKNFDQFIELDSAFHRRLLQAAGLAPLIPFSDLLTIFFKRFRETIKKKNAEWLSSVAVHQQILDHLRSSQVPEASALLREHILNHKSSTVETRL